MKRACVLMAAISFVFSGGCATTLSNVQVGSAQTVSDMPGYHSIFRDGDIYFAGQPTEAALTDAAEKAGIRTVVNLRSAREMDTRVEFDEEALVKKLGMRYVHIPITPATLSVTQADQLHYVLGKTTEPVLIHCGSSNRVGALWAIYLNRHREIDIDEAISLGEKAGMKNEVLVEAVRRKLGLGD